MKNRSKDRSLSSKEVQQYIPFSLATIRRLSKDIKSDFPKHHVVGRSVYWNESDILKYLSKKAGFQVNPKDRTITAQEVLGHFNKSHTWLWQNIAPKGNIPKPFYINRSRFWVKSQIDDLHSAPEV